MKTLVQVSSVSLVLATAMLVPVVGATTVDGDSSIGQSGQALLMKQMRLGETLYRDDIVIDAANRLERIQENHPQAMLARLRIAVRLGQELEAQRLLDRLERLAPQTPEAVAGRTLIRLAEPDSVSTFTQGRLLSAVGRVEDALRIYDGLLQGVYPTADIALEYWQLYARLPGNRNNAIAQLQSLAEAYPSHAPVLSAVVSQLFTADRPNEALVYLRRLSQLKSHRASAATREYEYLVSLPIDSSNRERWRDFVDTYGDLEVGVQGREELVRFDAKLNDPVWQGGRQGVQWVENGKGAEAVQQLQAAVTAYPDDVEFAGALGIAYLRAGDRTLALHYFEQAKAKEPRIDRTYRWVSLIGSTRYWLLLEQASQAEKTRNWGRARELYAQALPLEPQSPFARIGLADSASALGQEAAAWRQYKQALRLFPQEAAVQRAVSRFLEHLPLEKALSLMKELPTERYPVLAPLQTRLTVRSLQLRAEQATEQQRWADVEAALLQAQQLDPDDPWISYGLARAMREQGRGDQGLHAFSTHLDRHRGAPSSHYAHGLLLAAVGQNKEALDTLALVPRAGWDERMTHLEIRLLDAQTIRRARAYRESGQGAAAVALLEQRPDSIDARLQVARWSQEDGDYPKALANYGAVLRMDGGDMDARLGQMEVWAAQGKAASVYAALTRDDLDLHAQPTGVHRRVAELWLALGDAQKARDVLYERSKNVSASEREPLLHRDLARLTKTSDPEFALAQYAQAMADADLLRRSSLEFPRDQAAFTRAMRMTESDGWLERGIRREAQDLYEQQNPTLTLHNDRWWRRDGTPGLSRLHADTTMLQLDYPIFAGKGFLRADHVRMDAGTLETDSDGVYRGEFGSCSFEAANTASGWQALPACTAGLRQRASGTSLAVGWQGERLAFDLGTTPMGFEVGNWTGGISYSGEIASLGWRLSASRRPMSNSLLSFAGSTDPATGTVWGGVMANGAALSLSWDQGQDNGVWADISHHQLKGKNVEDNHRTRIMGGYYRRLINKNNEVLSAGVNLMYWRYQKDLGDYSLGQGGYYSPQRYTSVSVPISYARRTSDWSFLLEGSVSRSFARSTNSEDGSRSSSTGYRVAGFVERRLADNWVLGAGLDIRRSKDYSPSHFILYLRYTFEPWQGDLPLGPGPLIPYAEFK